MKGNHVKFARFVLLAVSEEAKIWLPYHFFRLSIVRQLVDSVFVISLGRGRLGWVQGVRSNPLNWNRWRQRNCKILISQFKLECNKKTRPQNTMALPQNIGNRTSEDLNFKISQGRTPYGGPSLVVLISNPLLWNPRSAPVSRIIKVSVIILNITKTSSKICLCMSYLVNDDDGAISESSAISWPMKKLARCSDVRLLQLLRLELLPRSKRSSVNINKNK